MIRLLARDQIVLEDQCQVVDIPLQQLLIVDEEWEEALDPLAIMVMSLLTQDLLSTILMLKMDTITTEKTVMNTAITMRTPQTYGEVVAPAGHPDENMKTKCATH